LKNKGHECDCLEIYLNEIHKYLQTLGLNLFRIDDYTFIIGICLDYENRNPSRYGGRYFECSMIRNISENVIDVTDLKEKNLELDLDLESEECVIDNMPNMEYNGEGMLYDYFECQRIDRLEKLLCENLSRVFI
jgi:hypothetical protein